MLARVGSVGVRLSCLVFSLLGRQVQPEAALSLRRPSLERGRRSTPPARRAAGRASRKPESARARSRRCGRAQGVERAPRAHGRRGRPAASRRRAARARGRAPGASRCEKSASSSPPMMNTASSSARASSESTVRAYGSSSTSTSESRRTPAVRARDAPRKTRACSCAPDQRRRERATCRNRAPRSRHVRARRAPHAGDRRHRPEFLLPLERLAFELDLGAALDPRSAQRLLQLGSRRRSADDAVAAVGAEDPEPRATPWLRPVLEVVGQLLVDERRRARRPGRARRARS